MFGLWLLFLSVAIQLAAGLMAIRLVRVTGFRAAWCLMAAAMWGMALRRIISLYVHLTTDTMEHLQHGFEALGLVTSALLLAGVILIRPVFRSIQDAQQAAETLAAEKAALAVDLKQALSRVQVLSGLLPVCSGCKKVRDSSGNWHEIEGYIARHSDARFSHGLCPECGERLYPEFYGRP